MTRKKGRRDMHKASTDGVRDRCCPRCRVFLRSTDFTSTGICLWCAWELGEAARLLSARKQVITWNSYHNSPTAPDGK